MKIGIYSPYLDTVGGGERYILTIAEHLSKKHQVDIFWNDPSIRDKAQKRLSLSLKNINFVDNIFGTQNRINKIIKTRQYDLIFYLSDGSIPFTLAKHNILHFQRPFERINSNSVLNQLKLKRFQTVICNSHFTKKWIDKEYNVNSLVVYPPVPVEQFKAQKKENIILSVGRFHQFKKHEIMIDMFKEFQKRNKGWKLVIIGGLLPQDQRYFDVLNQTKNDAIILLPTVSFSDLQTYYSSAKIYWHAAGFGYDTQKNPELMEHFGITIVEAMAAGCIPVVYDGGGISESVIHKESGYLWNDKKGCLLYTQYLIDNPQQYKLLQDNAQKRSQNFNIQRFNKRMDEIIKQIS